MKLPQVDNIFCGSHFRTSFSNNPRNHCEFAKNKSFQINHLICNISFSKQFLPLITYIAQVSKVYVPVIQG